MKHNLFDRVTLTVDVPQHNLQDGDVATVVENHGGTQGQEEGYTVDVFNAVGESVAVVTLKESEIDSLNAKGILHVRPLAASA